MTQNIFFTQNILRTPNFFGPNFIRAENYFLKSFQAEQFRLKFFLLIYRCVILYHFCCSCCVSCDFNVVLYINCIMLTNIYPTLTHIQIITSKGWVRLSSNWITLYFLYLTSEHSVNITILLLEFISCHYFIFVP